MGLGLPKAQQTESKLTRPFTAKSVGAFTRHLSILANAGTLSFTCHPEPHLLPSRSRKVGDLPAEVCTQRAQAAGRPPAAKASRLGGPGQVSRPARLQGCGAWDAGGRQTPGSVYSMLVYVVGTGWE